MPRAIAAKTTFILFALTAIAQVSHADPMNPQERVFMIVEYNSAMRPERKEVSLYAAPETIRRVKTEDAQLDSNERKYVAGKIADWKTRYRIPDQDVQLLHPSGTGPYVLEASRETIRRIINDNARDGFISFTPGMEVLDFEISRLNRVFSTTDERLLGEFIDAHFKNEILYAVWNATNLTPSFSEATEVHQTIVKAVSGIALEKLEALRDFLEKRGSRYYKGLLRIQRISKQIMSGYIAIESLPNGRMFVTQSDFFESLQRFDRLGVQLLLLPNGNAPQIIDRWVKFQSLALELPETEGKPVPTHSEILKLFGHKTTWVREQFLIDLTNMILDYEDGRHLRVSGVSDLRLVQVALRIAQVQEEIERRTHTMREQAPMDRTAQLERRYAIAESLVRKTAPEAEIRLDQRTSVPPRLLLDITAELFRVDVGEGRLGSNFSRYFYRQSVLQVLNALFSQVKNETFRQQLQEQTTAWFERLRAEGQETGLPQAMRLVELQMNAPGNRACREVFRSAE